MKPTDPFYIYEFFDQNSDASQLICDGHVDSTKFRDQCLRDFDLEPLVIRHQWQKTRRVTEQRPGRKRKNTITQSYCLPTEVSGSKPVTIGLL